MPQSTSSYLLRKMSTAALLALEIVNAQEQDGVILLPNPNPSLPPTILPTPDHFSSHRGRGGKFGTLDIVFVSVLGTAGCILLGIMAYMCYSECNCSLPNCSTCCDNTNRMERGERRVTDLPARTRRQESATDLSSESEASEENTESRGHTESRESAETRENTENVPRRMIRY